MISSPQNNLTSPQNKIDPRQNLFSPTQQRPDQTQWNAEATHRQNGEESAQKTKRPRQHWSDEEQELFLGEITQYVVQNPQATREDILTHLQGAFKGKRNRGQLRRKYESYEKSGKLPAGAPRTKTNL